MPPVRWVGVATAAHQDWIGQLWRATLPDGTVQYRIGRRAPRATFGYRSWQNLARVLGCVIRWPDNEIKA